jgi:hypothetical protein
MNPPPYLFCANNDLQGGGAVINNIPGPTKLFTSTWLQHGNRSLSLFVSTSPYPIYHLLRKPLSVCTKYLAIAISKSILTSSHSFILPNQQAKISIWQCQPSTLPCLERHFRIPIYNCIHKPLSSIASMGFSGFHQKLG